VKDALVAYPDVILQNETEILGTGGSLRCALDHFDDAPVLVMNGDIYHTVDIKQLYTHHLENSVPVTMAMHDYDRFNTVAIENGRVRSFNHRSAGPKMAFTGIHVINPGIIEMIPKDKFFHIIDLYQQLAEEKKINLLNVSGAYWRDIGTVSDYLELHRELLAMRGSTSCFEIGENVKISSNAQLEKWCVIGCNSVVYDHCLLSGAVVWENSVVNRGAVVRDTIVTGTSSDGD
jgi:mannose-1-phosphate guanylyltransferase